MRTLMLTSSYPQYEDDYRGGFVRDLALALRRDGLRVEVAAPRPPEGAPPPFDDEIAVHWLPAFFPLSSSAFYGNGIEDNLRRRPWSAFSLPPLLVAYALEVAARAIFFDALVAHWLLPMGVVGAAVARFSGKPLAVVAHSAPPRVPMARVLTRWILENSRVTVCVSRHVRNRLSDLAGGAAGLERRLRMLELGIDLRPSAWQPHRRGRLRALFVGRLVSRKGLSVALEAIRACPGCTLTVVGDGPSRTELRRAGEGVTWLGQLPRSRVRALMQEHDVLLVPSVPQAGREEGLPTVVLEAWSCGLPILASAIGGIAEVVVQKGGGLLFKPGDVGDLAHKLGALAVDESLLVTLRTEALDAVREYSWDRKGPEWARLLREHLS